MKKPHKKHKKSHSKAFVGSLNQPLKTNRWLFLLILLPAVAIIAYFVYDKYRANDLRAKAGDLQILPIFDDEQGSSIVACKKFYQGDVVKTVFIYKKPVGQKNTESHLQGVETKAGNQWWGDEVNAMEVEVPESGYLNIGMSKDGVRYINESVPLRGIPECYWD